MSFFYCKVSPSLNKVIIIIIIITTAIMTIEVFHRNKVRVGERIHDVL